MNLRVLALLFFPVIFLLIPYYGNAQVDEQDNVYLVLLDIRKSSDIALCYSSSFDKNKVKITYAYEDTVNYLADFIYEEEALVGPECFIPELKLIFRNYTYVVSLYCSKVIKFENTSAFTTSSRRMKNDLVFTESVLSYLEKLKYTHFGRISANRELIAKVVTSEPIEEISEDGSSLDMLLNEGMDEEDESKDFDMEMDKVDKIIIEDETINIDDDFDDFDDDKKKTTISPKKKKKGGR